MEPTTLQAPKKGVYPPALKKYHAEQRRLKKQQESGKKTSAKKKKGLGAPASSRSGGKGKKDYMQKFLNSGGKILAGTGGFLIGEQIHKALLPEDPNATEFGSWLEIVGGLALLVLSDNEYLEAAGIGIALNGARHAIVKMEPGLAGAMGAETSKKMPAIKMYKPTLADEGMNQQAIEKAKTMQGKPNTVVEITPEAVATLMKSRGENEDDIARVVKEMNNEPVAVLTDGEGQPIKFFRPKR